MNGNMIPKEWKENFRMSERSFCILHGKLKMHDVINNLYHLIASPQMETRSMPDQCNNIFVSIGL